MDIENLLVEKVVAGEKNAFTGIVEKYKRLVAHIVYKMIPDANIREDVCQEVFVKVYQNLSGYKRKAKLSTWIGRITYNYCIDLLNKKKISIVDEDFEESARYLADSNMIPDEKMQKAELSTKIQSEIDCLPVRYGTILVLYHLHDMSYNEISDVLSLPEGTVKSYLFRGRKILKERLESKYNIEEIWR